MTKSLLILVIVILFSSQQKPDSEDSKSQNISISEIADSLTNELIDIHKQGYFNGYSVAIVNEHGILYQNGFGLADLETKKQYTENTIQSTGSISKTLIGISLLMAKEMGKLNLDDPINDYLPFDVSNPFYPEDEITIRHLANHTSTILDTDYYDKSCYMLESEKYKLNTAPTEVVDYFNSPGDSISIFDHTRNLFDKKGESCCEESFLNEKPGKVYKYSNLGATLGAVILEIATEVSFNDFTTKYILSPLEMTSSGWSAKEVNTENLSRLYSNADTVYAEYYGVDYPSGGLISSSIDLGKYLTELIKGYLGHGTLLNKDSYRELFGMPHREDIFSELKGENVNPILNMRYDKGVFMGLAPRGYIGHTGQDYGVVSFMFFNTQSKTGRIVIINTTILGDNEEELNELWSIWDKLEKYQSKLGGNL